MKVIKKFIDWTKLRSIEIMVSLLLISLTGLTALPYCMVFIEAGHEGVHWRRFGGGTDVEQAYPEGTAFIFPWDKMTVYDARLRRINAEYNSLASNGLEIILTVSFRFRPYLEHIPMLHKYVGEDYVDVLLLPEMGAHVRKVISTYKPEELYSVRRDVIQQQILDSIRNEIAVTTHDKTADDDHVDVHTRDYIHIDDVLIRGIKLPEAVRRAIEGKERAKQSALTYTHRLESEKMEKIRKRIEAEGIRDFQTTIANGISDKYLKWKAIKATLELAKSPNSKVVIIGGEGGLPVILGDEFMKDRPKKAKTPKIEPQSAENAPTPTGGSQSAERPTQTRNNDILEFMKKVIGNGSALLGEWSEKNPLPYTPQKPKSDNEPNKDTQEPHPMVKKI